MILLFYAVIKRQKQRKKSCLFRYKSTGKRQLLMNKVFIYLIKFYRYFISPMMASRCRFYPTCSEYGLQAFEEYGAIKAIFLTLKRLLRCHPFCEGGVDPLPIEKKPNG
jgi:putative membrane protein insertion efficiency factor